MQIYCSTRGNESIHTINNPTQLAGVPIRDCYCVLQLLLEESRVGVAA